MERSLPCTMQMSQPEEGWLICMDIYGQREAGFSLWKDICVPPIPNVVLIPIPP